MIIIMYKTKFNYYITINVKETLNKIGPSLFNKAHRMLHMVHCRVHLLKLYIYYVDVGKERWKIVSINWEAIYFDNACLY